MQYFSKMVECNQQQGQKIPLQLFVSLSFTMTIGFLSQKINKGRFLEVWMMVMMNSVFDTQESSLWNEDIKACRVQVFKFHFLLLSWWIMTCQSHTVINKLIQDEYSKVPSSGFLFFFFCLTNVVFLIVLNPLQVYFHDQVLNDQLFWTVGIKWITLSPLFAQSAHSRITHVPLANEVIKRISEGNLGWLLLHVIITLLFATCPFRQMPYPLPVSHSLMQYAEISPFCLKLQIYLKHELTMYSGEDHRLPLS